MTQPANKPFDPMTSIMSHFDGALRKARGEQQEKEEEMSQSAVAWKCLDQVWRDLVFDGADSDALHELVIHTVNYVQAEARLMVFSDLAALHKRTKGVDA
jgi:hypothetical protein